MIGNDPLFVSGVLILAYILFRALVWLFDREGKPEREYREWTKKNGVNRVPLKREKK